MTLARRAFFVSTFAFGLSILLLASDPSCAQVGSDTPGQRIGHFRGAQTVAVSSDGSLFALQADRTVTLYDSHTGVEHFHVDIADIPASDSLVHNSAEPLQAQESVLLRAATETTETQEAQLLRASGGQE